MWLFKKAGHESVRAFPHFVFNLPLSNELCCGVLRGSLQHGL